MGGIGGLLDKIGKHVAGSKAAQGALVNHLRKSFNGSKIVVIDLSGDFDENHTIVKEMDEHPDVTIAKIKQYYYEQFKAMKESVDRLVAENEQLKLTNGKHTDKGQDQGI